MEDGIGQDDLLIGAAGLLLHRPEQPLIVGHGVVQGGGGEGQGKEGQIAGEVDAGGEHLGPQPLKNGDLLRGVQIGHLHAAAVGGGDIGHLNYRVAGDRGAAGQPPAVGVLLLGDVAAGGRVHLPLNQADPALAAAAVAGAGGVDGHVGLPGQLQEVFSRICVDGDADVAGEGEFDFVHGKGLLSVERGYFDRGDR